MVPPFLSFATFGFGSCFEIPQSPNASRWSIVHFHGRRSHGVCRRFLSDLSRLSERGHNLEGSRRGVYPLNRFLILRRCGQSWCLEPIPRRGRSLPRNMANELALEGAVGRRPYKIRASEDRACCTERENRMTRTAGSPGSFENGHHFNPRI